MTATQWSLFAKCRSAAHPNTNFASRPSISNVFLLPPPCQQHFKSLHLEPCSLTTFLVAMIQVVASIFRALAFPASPSRANSRFHQDVCGTGCNDHGGSNCSPVPYRSLIQPKPHLNMRSCRRFQILKPTAQASCNLICLWLADLASFITSLRVHALMFRL